MNLEREIMIRVYWMKNYFFNKNRQLTSGMTFTISKKRFKHKQNYGAENEKCKWV